MDQEASDIVADRGSARPNAANTSSSWQVGGPRPVAGVQIWAKPLGQGKAAVLFINGVSCHDIACRPTPGLHSSKSASNIVVGQGSTNTSATVTLEELNITATGEVTATDVWTGADAGAVSNGHWSTGVVGTLDSAFVVIQASAAAGAN